MQLSPRLATIVSRAVLAIVASVTIVAAGVAIENWRGDHAWNAYLAECRAKGAPLELSAPNTPAIPDSQNLFKAPLLAEAIYERLSDINAKELRAARITAFSDALAAAGQNASLERVRASFEYRHLLKAPQADSPANDILYALEPAAPLLDAIRIGAKERSSAWLPFLWSSDPGWPELGTIWELGKLLAFRSKIELAAGHTTDAFDDLFATTRLAESCSAGSRTLLDILVGLALYDRATEILHQGCQSHTWDQNELVTLQSAFARYRPLQLLSESIRTNERNMALHVLDAWTADLKPPRPWWLIRGWALQNKVAASRYYDDLVSTFDSAAERVYPEKLDALSAQEKLHTNDRSPYRWITTLLGNKFTSVIGNFGRDIESLQYAKTAIALERHYVAHGAYPASLAELSPELLKQTPHSIMSGEPLVYVRTTRGAYELRIAESSKKGPEPWTVASVAR
jgi:hypothetical protein